MNCNKSSCSLDSSNEDNNSIDLRETKQMLLSGIKEQTSLAANRILSQMRNDEQILLMISSDITEFLCDAMSPYDVYISRAVYQCLEIMTRYESFFTQYHSSFAMETVIRSLHFLIKDSSHEYTLYQSIDILQQIVKGYATYNVLPEKKPFQKLLNLISIILKNVVMDIKLLRQIGMIILSLLELKIWEIICSDDPLEICDKWFDLISIRSRNFASSPEEIIQLGCALGEHILRYLTSNDKIDNDIGLNCKFDPETNTSLIMKVTNFLLEIAAPHFTDEAFMGQNTEIEHLKNFLTCLMYYYNELFPQRFIVTRKLSEMGFIHTLTTILSKFSFASSTSIGKTCIVILFEMILSLSDDVFLFPDMWPNGRDHFRKEILKGATMIPENASLWADLVTDADFNRSARLALLIYFYFQALTIKSSYNMDKVHPSVTKLLNSSTGISSAPILNKAVWFIFVMSQMSKTPDSPGTVNEAMRKLLAVLENEEDLSLIYTHHPALLYWAFSSSTISYSIQCKVVKQWLENRSPECSALDDLVEKSANVRLAIFGLLQSGHDHISHSAFSTLKKFMLQSEDDNLSCNIWFVLPQTMAKYTTHSFNAVNVDYIVELASLKIPERPDMSKILRVASLLPEVLDKSNLISLSSSLKIILQLLQISTQYDDSRVLFAILRYKGFSDRILTGIGQDQSELVSTALKILTILWSREDSVPLETHPHILVKLNPYLILNILNGTDLDLITTGLLLMEKMLSTKFESKLIIVEETSKGFINILLYDLENISFRYFPAVSGIVWKCLTHCLLITDEQDLSEDVLLNEVIKFNLSYLKDTPEMADFLIVWMESRVKSEKFYTGNRCVRDSYFLETIREVVSYLSENPFPDFENLCQKVLNCCHQLSLDTSQSEFTKIQTHGRSSNGFGLNERSNDFS